MLLRYAVALTTAKTTWQTTKKRLLHVVFVVVLFISFA